jgi:hypothetical protein
MDQFVLGQIIVFGIFFVIIAIMIMINQDSVIHRRAEKIWVRIDERRRAASSRPPEEQDLEMQAALLWIVIGSILILILFALALAA